MQEELAVHADSAEDKDVYIPVLPEQYVPDVFRYVDSLFAEGSL